MITIRKSDDRGRADHGWLDSRHTFSFAGYYDPEQMGFRDLRVINEDRVAAGEGFGAHDHQDMEIVSYVLSGSLAHKDSMGHEMIMGAGSVQRMTAGSGVTHSEMNPSSSEPVHFLQIWIRPATQGLEPGYEQLDLDHEVMRDEWAPVATPTGRDGSLTIHQDVEVLASILAPGSAVTYSLAPGRHAWLQVVRGTVELGGKSLSAGDGAAISDEEAIDLTGIKEAEVLLFDMA